MRRIMLTNKKIRGKRRLFRSLRQWAENLAENFPAPRDIGGQPYWHWKIPVPSSLVEGGQAKLSEVISCVQSLIDAAAQLQRRRPDWTGEFRIVCTICLPDIFSSEVCVYFSEDYFKSMISGWRFPDDFKRQNEPLAAIGLSSPRSNKVRRRLIDAPSAVARNSAFPPAHCPACGYESLAKRWNLNLPPEFEEILVEVASQDDADSGGVITKVWWFFGELGGLD